MNNIEKIKQIGSEWIENDMHRIYINNLSQFYGLDVVEHKTGNIKQAKLDGEKISNNKATKLRIELNSAKLWYDLKSNQFESKYLSDEQFSKIIVNINSIVGA